MVVSFPSPYGAIEFQMVASVPNMMIMETGFRPLTGL